MVVAASLGQNLFFSFFADVIKQRATRTLMAERDCEADTVVAQNESD